MEKYLVMERARETIARPNQPASYRQYEISRHDTLEDAQAHITSSEQWVVCPDGRQWIGGVYLDD